MICWYCHWGWPKAVADIYLKALADLDGCDTPLLYGPAHIVWGDENFDSAEWCLEHFDDDTGDYTVDEMTIVRQSLLELKKLPEEVIDIEPDDYDGEHPERYPPPSGIEMVKV